MLLALSALFLLLLAMGTPVYVFIGLPAILAIILLTNSPLSVIPATIFNALDSPALANIPLYILLGNLLAASGTSRHIVNFFDSLLRQFPGGLALVAVMSSMFFAGMTGSTSTDAMIVGLLMIQPMVDAGYDKKFVMGLICAGGTLGPLIPPSVPMVIYSIMTEQSTGALFLAGIGPGLLIGGLLLVYSIIVSQIKGYGRRPPASWGERWQAFRVAFPIMILPLVIAASIYGGFATPTEVGAVAAAYTFLVSTLIYRSLSRSALLTALRDTLRLTSMIFLIIAASELMGYTVTYLRIPQGLVDWIVAQHLSAPVFLLVVDMILLILGVPIEALPLLFMTLPLLYPMLGPLGISPIHFGTIMVANMTLAAISPPVGVVLFVIAAIAKAPTQDVFRGVLPFFFLLIGALLVITFWPDLSLFLVKR